MSSNGRPLEEEEEEDNLFKSGISMKILRAIKMC
jgi:hypothetical protein